MSHRSVPGDTSNSPGQGSAQDCFKCVAKQFAECDLIQLPGQSGGHEAYTLTVKR